MSTSGQSVLAATLDARVAPLRPGDRLAEMRAALPGRVVFTTSFGLEDQAIVDMIAERGLDIAFATLDTGRMFPETYDVWARTEEKYAIKIEPFHPDAKSIEALVHAQGINGFRHSIDARKACCDVRKVEPLGRALAGAQGWIVGLRADQSEHRGGLGFATFDAARDLVKLSPLFDWTREQVAAYCQRRGVPINPLHDKGFLSIGCAPCTRAVLPGEPERAGRWWWEQEDKKECGLHVAPDGRLARGAALEPGPIEATR